MLNRSQRNFAHITTVTLSWLVQNFVLLRRLHFQSEHFKFWCNFEFDRNIISGTGAWGRFKKVYELLNLGALKFSTLYIFQCMGKIFCVEFRRVPLEFHTKIFYPYIERCVVYREVEIQELFVLQDHIQVFLKRLRATKTAAQSSWPQYFHHL